MPFAALRSVEKYLGLEKLYVLGTNCGEFSIQLSRLDYDVESNLVAHLVCLLTQFCKLFMWLSVDNGPRQGLDKFLKAASDDPETVLHYEFMQDYKVSHNKVL